MFILTLSCPDQPGLIAAVTTCLAHCGCNIEEAAQFHEQAHNHFFMRIIFSGSEVKFSAAFTAVADQFNMIWQITPLAQPVKTIILVSQWDHCLCDLLYRVRTGHLNIEITAVVSNHETARDIVEERGVPFHYIPTEHGDKAARENQMRQFIKDTHSELVVLARYMQILSADFCHDYHGRVINIHHSFLPGFKGAKPYHQAYERGVKMIGASAHFATPDLDDGPIIAQNVQQINHTHTPTLMQALGRDIEAHTLAQAVTLYAARRIFTHQARTIIL